MCGDFGFRLMLKVTGGVRFHWEIERPISPNLLYYRVFVISQPAAPGTVKELNAAAKALERLIDATDTVTTQYGLSLANFHLVDSP